MTQNIRIPIDIWEKMRKHIHKELPNEACGLLAGKENLVAKIFCMTNIEKSPTRFRLDAQEQINAFMEMEFEKMDLIAIYHSHPNGPIGPSVSDISEAHYPDACYLIWSNFKERFTCNGYRINNKLVEGIEITIISESNLNDI